MSSLAYSGSCQYCRYSKYATIEGSVKRPLLARTAGGPGGLLFV